MRSRLLAVALFLIVSNSVASAETPWVTLSIDSSGAIVVPVNINGRGPFLFLLDTGSSHSVMSQPLVDHLDLRLVARTAVLTSTSREMRTVVRLDLTTIGSARSVGLLASVVPSTHLASITRGIDGIIGQDFLLGLNYTLDYRRKRLWWADAREDEHGTRLPLIVQDGRYLIQIPLVGTGRSVRLVPDSGASGLVIFARDGRTCLPLEPDSNLMRVLSVSGRQDVRAMMLRELKLGDVTVRNQPVAVVARDPRDVLEGDGLLPLHLFDSVSFNAHEQQLTIRERK